MALYLGVPQPLQQLLVGVPVRLEAHGLVVDPDCLDRRTPRA
jgi:hypothetical protein